MRPVPARLLLVDDRAEDRTVLETILAPLGQELVMAGSGEEALRQVLKSEFAVILLDVEMPGLDGFETARMIRDRERSRQIPIIFVSGTAVTDAQQFRGYASGAVDYMLKPIVAEILRWKVQVFVDLFQLRNERDRQITLLETFNQELRKVIAERERIEQERTALATKLKTLSGLLPICSGCKRIRDDQGQWNQLENYISERSTAHFSHGLCPECARKYYPDCLPQKAPP